MGSGNECIHTVGQPRVPMTCLLDLPTLSLPVPLSSALPCERVCSRSLRYVDSHSPSLHLPCVRISFFLKAESYSIASCAALFSHSLLGGHGLFPPLLWLASTCFSHCCQLGRTNSSLTPCFQISEFHTRSSCWILC